MFICSYAACRQEKRVEFSSYKEYIFATFVVTLDGFPEEEDRG
jgi:hypothetical protein